MADELRDARVRGYESVREDVMGGVPRDARAVLDLGCSSGALGAALMRRQDCRVVGVEIDADLATDAAGRLERVVNSGAEEFLADAELPEAPFDCLVCADVLEHLIDPWSALERAVKHVRSGGTVIVSLPNAIWYHNGLRLVREQRWPREDEGIFDRTHLRWFSLSDAEALMAGAGVCEIETELALWETRRAHRWILERLSSTRARPYLGAQHLLVGRRA